jgi:hypothetical protein
MASEPRDVFVNCAFDTQFKPVFDGIVFAVLFCGFQVRSALEADDGSENRLNKILRIVEGCPYGIHDISRTQSDGDPPLPRFNMPLELGVFLGAKRYGDARQKRKRVLILDTEQYRYQRFMSDIAGQDIHAHGDDPKRAIVEVANWLRVLSERRDLPGGQQIAVEYVKFQAALPGVLRDMSLHPADMSFRDYVAIASAFIDPI